MRTILLTWAPVCLVAVFWLLPRAVHAQLKPGDKAPDFKLVGSDGKTYSLAQFHGKKPVVIAWYPKAFTGG